MKVLLACHSLEEAIAFETMLASALEMLEIEVLPPGTNPSAIEGAYDLILFEESFISRLRRASTRQKLWDALRPNTVWVLADTFDLKRAVLHIESGATQIVLKSQPDHLIAMLKQWLNEHESAYPELTSHFADNDILRGLSETATDVIWAKNLIGRYQFINHAGADFLGRSIDEIMGRDDEGFFSRETFARVRATDIQVRIKEASDTAEFILNSTAGLKNRYYLAMKAPFRNKSGDINGIIGIVRDITARKILENELLQSKIHAEESNQRKSQFISNLSHELRTPLHNIITSSSAALAGVIPNPHPNAVSYFKLINNNGKHLLQLIDGILDISSIEAGKFTIQENEIQLKVLIEDSLSLVKTLIESKHQRIASTIGPEVPKIFKGDYLKLKQALCNLLSNANKFSPEGTTIEVHCSVALNNLVLSVRDQGPGIHESAVSRIFDPFEQCDMEGYKDNLGTGLGLPIAKKIVELHGGRLEVETEYGKGALFSIRIPLSKGQPTQDAVGKKHQPSRKKVKASKKQRVPARKG